MNKTEVKLVTIILMIHIVFIPLIPISNTSSSYPQQFFSVSILCPNTSGYTWVAVMVEQFPKIGIKVEVFDQTGRAQISPRTWGYSGPYPIPTYAEGGFDILFVNWSWSLDTDMKGFFDTPSICPNGYNIYQYSRPEMDWAIGNYSQSFVLADRIQNAHDIQALLYEDVPQATILYPQEVLPHNPNLISSSWNPLLWYLDYQDMSNWEIPGQTEFHYAVPYNFEDFHVLLETKSIYDTMWQSQIYGGMVERTPEDPYNNAFGPYLADSFTSTNGINYSVILNSDAKFADGVKCNASDVEYSYDLFISPFFRQPGYGFYSDIMDDNTIKIISEFEVQVDFLQAYVFQDALLGINILPKHIWDSIDPGDHIYQAGAWAINDTLDSNLMGIGPYYLYDCDANNETIHLKANPYWANWGNHSAQKFTDIYFEYYSNKESALSALAVGDVDMVDTYFRTQISEVPSSANYTKVTRPGSIEIAFNTLHPYLGTGELCPINSPDSGKYIRKAISHIIPRDFLIAEMYGGLGEPGVTAFPKGAIGFDDSLEPYEYNLGLAKEYMRLAGFDIPSSHENAFVINLPFMLGIIACIGGGIVIFNRRRRR
ncbi:MAG: hypothetical protein GPJ52_08175 [Candidatus Heimdallarchaeota archaeon]|nr:hypothetical protein [Candidatus Heimdallarchaeota archaeon]